MAVIRRIKQLMLGLEQNAQSSTRHCHVVFTNKTVAGALGRSDTSGRQEEAGMAPIFDGTNQPRSVAPIIPTGVKTKPPAPSPRVELINAIERNHIQALNLLLRQGQGRQTHISPLSVSSSPVVQLTQQAAKIPPAPPPIASSTSSAFTACPASVPSRLTYTLVYLLGKILCIRSGAELRAMHLWNTLKLFPMHKLPQHNQKVVMEYELHYTLPPDPPVPPPALYENSKRLLSLSERARGNRFIVILDHILVKTQKGFWREKHGLELTPISTQLETRLEDGRLLPLMGGQFTLIEVPYRSTQRCSSHYNCSRHPAHPKCLDFWPEVAERARHGGVWQCTDCKSCSVCKNKKGESVILICDACDKGFHGNCHSPVVPEKSADQTAPWICSECRAEGYRVRVGNVSVSAPVSTPSSADSGVSSLVISTSEGVVSTSSVTSKADQPPTTTPMTSTSGPVDPPLAESTEANDASLLDDFRDAVPENLDVPVQVKEPETNVSAKQSSTLTTTDLTEPPPMEVGEKAGGEEEEVGEDAEEDDSMPPNLGTPHHDSPASETPLPQTGSGRPEDVRLWTVDHVADWLREQGGFEKEAEAFRHQDIDGTSLLLLKSMNLLTGVGIKMGPAIKICDRIKHLQLLQARVESRSVG
ncbi:Histone acetyltransferase KAT6A [Taenia solium]|eukprot:TsM_000939200 transcript=TsM_000939200 gene=TsM_000939200